MKTSNPLTVICIVKENIRRAAESYAIAAIKNQELGRNLFKQLSEFEKYHYDRFSALVISLQKKQHFTKFEGREFVLPPILERNIVKEPAHKSLMQIISDAMEIEKQTEKALDEIGDQIPGSQGRRFFNKLSEEEHKNYHILSEAFRTLNQSGIWKWSHP